jgi:phosphoesterase RecJ-like protein
MTKEVILEINQLLSQPKKVVIVPHKNPDGDAIGSTLGLCHYLNSKGHSAVVIAPNDYPQFLKWLPGNNQALIYESEPEMAQRIISDSDVLFTLDFNALHRAGDMEKPLQDSQAKKILIDHHQQPDGFADFVYSDVAMSSTSEMVYHFLDMLGEKNAINADIATCLYVGIMTDTGSFRFPSTTKITHLVISDLIEKGANNAEIHNAIYDTNSYNRLQLLGRSLNNLKVIPELSTAYIALSQDDLNEFNFKKGDTEGVVNYALSVEGINFALIFIEERKEGIVKISLRSKGNFNVNAFARKHYDGGGHINAAGGRSELSLQDTIDEFISILPSYKNDLTS